VEKLHKAQGLWLLWEEAQRSVLSLAQLSLVLELLSEQVLER
jgi:hypothetical protein